MKKCSKCGEYLPDYYIQCSRCLEFIDGIERVDEKCECGNLAARLTKNTVEIKCRRCKRVVVIRVDSLAEDYSKAIERQVINKKRPSGKSDPHSMDTRQER